MHLTQAQRYEIAALLKTNTPQKKIAEVIGVHPSTICREIKRNLTPAGNYSPTQAQMFAKALAREENKALRYYKKMGLLHSITTDNGSEFAKFKTIERSLKTPVYFAHPYQSWDKPHIEYLNKLLRQFIPKSSTFEDLTDADLRRFQNLLNNRPRKNLNYKTPNEVIKNIILEKLH